MSQCSTAGKGAVADVAHRLGDRETDELRRLGEGVLVDLRDRLGQHQAGEGRVGEGKGADLQDLIGDLEVYQGATAVEGAAA